MTPPEDAEVERLLAARATRQPTPSSRLARAHQIASGGPTTPSTPPRRPPAAAGGPTQPNAEADRLVRLFEKGRSGR